MDAHDLLLRKVGQRLSTVVRDSDTLARYGDDEFAVVLTSARQTADLVYAAHRLQEAFSKPFSANSSRAAFRIVSRFSRGRLRKVCLGIIM